MTKEVAIKWAKHDMCEYGLEGYVLIKPVDCETGTEYDFILFDSYLEMKNLIIGIRAYDFLDNAAYLRDGEMIVEAYSKSHIIIL